jgi:polyisoprenyl-teichoic acid--peptidoglycan teichoic acid transferase
MGGFVEENSRVALKKQKKRFKKRWILYGFLFVIVLISTYIVYEYNAGKKAALEKIGNDPVKEAISKQYEDEFKGVKDDLEKVNVLIIGSDSRGEKNARSDTIMIAQYDPDTNEAKLVSIMRDSYVNIPGIGYRKINAAFANGGPELLRKTIKETFGVDVQYYAIIDFQGFIHVVDTIAPDGIEVEVEKHMSEKIGVVLEPGLQTLNGEELLGYARFRADAQGDFGRVERQQKVMKLLMDEIVSFTGVLKLPRVVGTIMPYIDTNMDTSTIISLGSDFLLNPPKDLKTLSIPNRDLGSVWDSYVPGAGSVLEFAESEQRQIIQNFLNN